MKNQNVITWMGAGLVAAGLLSACGKDADHAKGEIDKKAEQASLASTWQSPCEPTSLKLTVLGFPSTQVQLRLGLGSDLSATTQVFAEGNCATPTVSVVENGNYTVGAKTPANANLFDAHIDTVSVTALTDAGRDKLNAAQYCGVNDWKTGQARDVTVASQNNGLLAPPCFTKAPRNIYDIAIVDNNQLRMGLENNGLDATAPEKRPVELDQQKVFTRK